MRCRLIRPRRTSSASRWLPEHRVLHASEKLDHDAVAQPVFGHVGARRVSRSSSRELASAARRSAAIGLPFSGASPPLALRMPDRISSSSDWPLPATPAMPTISPALTSRSIPSSSVAPLLGRQRQAAHFEHGRARRHGFFRRQRAHAAADHHLGQPGRVGVGGGHGADHGAAAHHGDGIGVVEDLAQLVRDEQDGLALVLERLQDAEQVVGFLLGVSTAVGSSRISTSAPRYKAFSTSTRCCWPTRQRARCARRDRRACRIRRPSRRADCALLPGWA
jgi:hypothetical protein